MTLLPKHPITVLLVCLITTLDSAAALAREEDPFRIETKPAKIGYISTNPEPIDQNLLGVPMLDELAGVITIIEPKAYTKLRRALTRTHINPTTLTSETYIASFHLHRDDRHRVLEIHDLGSELLALRSADNPDAVWSISNLSFERLGIRWASKAPSPPAPDGPDPIVFELPKPYTQSTTILDRRTVRARFKQPYPALTRIPDHELYRVRLPKDYNPDFPAGVLVWISPSPDGRIPTIFGPILDKLGFIAIGIDNNGNKRAITDRLANHLDSIESLAAHYRIDRSRIYLTGMSGGGRCSAILLLAFPDLFAGAVPIAGLDTYHNAPTGDPGKYWPARLGKPAGRWMKILKNRRIASITGSADANQPEMTVRTELLKRDGIDARIDIIEGIAHAMPTDEQFADALDWVDQPRRSAMIDSFKQAKSLMREYTERFGQSPPPTPAARRLLIRIITLAPWTDPAWQAAGLLGDEQKTTKTDN